MILTNNSNDFQFVYQFEFANWRQMSRAPSTDNVLHSTLLSYSHIPTWSWLRAVMCSLKVGYMRNYRQVSCAADGAVA